MSAISRQYGEAVVLKDGGSLFVRTLQPGDAERIASLGDTATFVLSDLDTAAHVALAAVVHDETGERVVAVGSYRRIDPAASTADVAFAVRAEDQGRGIGTLLLEHLAVIARADGIDDLSANVMRDDAKALAMFADSGFVVRSSIADGIVRLSFPIKSTDAFLATSAARERHATAESLKVFFDPSSIAIVGASSREENLGHAILKNVRNSGFRGPIYPVNSHAQEIDGSKCWPSVSAIGAHVDLAVVAVPAAAVEDVAADCARAGVKGIIVISSGFAEVSADGKESQARLRRLVRSSGMRLIGPNCMGVLSADPARPMNATFAPTFPPPGNVSILSQSGALALALLDHATALRIGIANFVSVGNTADVSPNDLLSYWGDDPKTQVIALYLESFGNPRSFARIAPRVARTKPIVAVKAGRSTAGTRAAASHSAALTSLDVGIDALFARAGVIRTNTLEEMFDVVALLSSQPVPLGSRVGVVTNGGGLGILLADACEAHGLTLPLLTGPTLDRLREFLPAQAGLANPIDLTAAATPEHYELAIDAVGADPNVDSVVAIYIPPFQTKPEEIAAGIARGAGNVPATKTVATVFMTSKEIPAALSAGPRGRLPTFAYPENAAIALAAAVRYGRWRQRPEGTTRELGPVAVAKIRAIVDRARAQTASESSWLGAADLAELLEIARIPFAPSQVVAPDPDAVAASAARFGYPVVLKAVASGLLHKSDVGGVILDVRDDEAARRSVDALRASLREAHHELSGVIVQRQIDGGVEALVGMSVDPSLGPLIVAGIGGVQVELLHDVAFRVVPVTDVDAAEMLDGLRATKLLDGFRGAPPADRAALIECIERVSALADAIPEILELELNPVKVQERGQGAIAVDARLRLSGKPLSP